MAVRGDRREGAEMGEGERGQVGVIVDLDARVAWCEAEREGRRGQVGVIEGKAVRGDRREEGRNGRGREGASWGHCRS